MRETGDPPISKSAGSRHRPVGAHQVPEMVEDLCDYINENWGRRNALHLCAYVMWRLNWIHPFTDGDGRTACAASYLVVGPVDRVRDLLAGLSPPRPRLPHLGFCPSGRG
ncbi:MAG: Fic family protein [Bryobacteraceae bacterium]|nr:Fic family protein [Bryobacteraceae bacterium]